MNTITTVVKKMNILVGTSYRSTRKNNRATSDHFQGLGFYKYLSLLTFPLFSQGGEAAWYNQNLGICVIFLSLYHSVLIASVLIRS